MLFWSGLWKRHVASSIQAAKSYITLGTATKTDASYLSKKVDIKNPTDTTNKKSVSPDIGSKPKPKVKQQLKKFINIECVIII
jgi:hypothetical protein